MKDFTIDHKWVTFEEIEGLVKYDSVPRVRKRVGNVPPTVYISKGADNYLNNTELFKVGNIVRINEARHTIKDVCDWQDNMIAIYLEDPPMKPILVYTRGYWNISNWSELLNRTSPNSKERVWVHKALDWVKMINGSKYK